MYKLFDKYVKIIEIENTSFCNRQCDFCGNAYIDRKSINYIMPEIELKKFLEDLNQINYGNVLNFNRYNEPFADKLVLDRISMARKILPEATLMCFTNSDYLDDVYLNQIRDVGLDILHVQLYSNETLDRESALLLLHQTRKRIGGHPLKIEPQINQSIIELSLNFPGMEVLIQYRNFDRSGNSRGGIVSQFEKKIVTGPCYQPTVTMAIDYNGNVMPCCHLRSDYAGHEEYILGNIFHEKIMDVYSSDKAVKFRKRLLSGDRPDVCRYCDDSKERNIRGR